MRNLFHCLILILFTVAAKADPTDRQAIFEKANQILPAVLLVADDMALVNNDFTGEEMRTFARILEVVRSDFQTAKKDRLQFSDDQELFKIDPSQPIRTAATSSDPKDPIFVNLKVINASANQFEIEDALQILVHEYGHKIANKNQLVVDSIAAKLRNYLGTLITRTTTDRGGILTALTLPNLVGKEGLTRLLGTRSDKEKALLMTALLFQNQNKVFDVTGPWASFIAEHPGFEAKQKDIFTNFGLGIWEMTFLRSDKARAYFSIEFKKDSLASPTGTMGGEHNIQMARQSSQDFKMELVLNHDSGVVESTFLRQRLLPQPQLRAKIASVKQKQGGFLEMEVQVRTPFDFRDAKILLETEKEQYAVMAKEVSRGHDKIIFEFKLPTFAQETQVVIQSFVFSDQGLLFFDEGMSVKVPAVKVPQGSLAFKDLHFSGGDGDYKTHLVVTVESPLDVQEVRVGMRETFSRLIPEAYFAKGQMPGQIPQSKIESVGSGYMVYHFDPSQFTQVRKGNNVEISIPLMKHRNDLVAHYPDKYEKLVLGVDEGMRAVMNVEVVDSGMRSVRAGGVGKSVGYTVQSPRMRKGAAAICSRVLLGHSVFLRTFSKHY